MNMRAAPIGLALLALLLVLLPFITPAYFLHLLIQALLWGFIYTAWALMGRFGLVSLGHGAFMGIGAYVPALLWNYQGLTPWIGIPLGVALAVLLALAIGYPCFRLKVVGHYFALVTLALGQVVLLSIVAARDITGGSLGHDPEDRRPFLVCAASFRDKRYFYAIALVVWLGGLVVWQWIDRGIGREALEAISEDEEAAAAVGIDVLREKLRVTVISAALTAFGGGIFGQYLMYLNPETISGIAVSLQIVFAAIAGGMYSLLGPTVGSLLTLSLTEGLRVWFGTSFIGAANTIYGILLVLFIIFMPRGIVGLIEGAAGWRARVNVAAMDRRIRTRSRATRGLTRAPTSLLEMWMAGSSPAMTIEVVQSGRKVQRGRRSLAPCLANLRYHFHAHPHARRLA